MNVEDAIRCRRTVHTFDPSRSVSEDVLRRALEAAHWAPCHLQTWPWRFFRMGPQARESLAEAYVEYKSQGLQTILGSAARERLRVKVLQAPVLIVATQVLADTPHRRKEDYAACAAAMQNLQLSLTGEGVGSKWSTSGVMASDTMYDLLGVGPEEQEVIGLMWVGYPSKKVATPVRPPLEDLMATVP